MTQKTDKELLSEAIDTLKKSFGFNVLKKPVKKGKCPETDSITIKTDNKSLKYALVIRKFINNTNLHLIEQQYKNSKIPPLLISSYINPMIAERMRAAELNFIDCVGNAYLNQKEVIIFIKGNKPEKENRVTQTKFFNPANLQVTFALLCDESLIQTTYRTIAQKADVAVGTVSHTMQVLKEKGFVIGKNRKRNFVSKKEVLMKWVTGYEESLHDKLTIGRYKAEDTQWWQKAELKSEFWSGEVAANILHRYLKPEIITIYTNKPYNEFILRNKLRADPKGNIEFLKPFWNFNSPFHEKKIVHPILVYADLLRHNDSRSKEAAQMIYENEIARYIE